MLRPDGPTSRAIDKATAELEFYQAVHGRGPIIFRSPDGSYLALTAVPMRTAPKFSVKFSRDDLRVDVVPLTGEPTHKMKFWICDRAGRNKSEDLRRYITSIEFECFLEKLDPVTGERDQGSFLRISQGRAGTQKA